MSDQAKEPGKGLAPGGEQLALSLCDLVNDKLSPQARGRYTAEQFKVQRPQEYAMTVELLSKNVFSKREIARVVEVAWETVVAVALEQEAVLRAGKRGMIKTLELVLAYSGDALIERAKAGLISPLEHAILVDKHQLLSGGVTERVGHVQEEDPAVAEFRRLTAMREVGPMALTMGPEMGKVFQEGGEALEALEAPLIELLPPAENSASPADVAQPPVTE